MLGKTISDLETGDVFEPVHYTLTPFMCAIYAHAIEEPSEWYYSAAAPFDRQVRPPTMVHSDKMRLLEANCTQERRIANEHTNEARIHYEYNAVQHGPAFVGEEIVVSGKIVERFAKRGGDYLHYEMRIESGDGRLITTYNDLTLLAYNTEGK